MCDNPTDPSARRGARQSFCQPGCIGGGVCPPEGRGRLNLTKNVVERCRNDSQIRLGGPFQALRRPWGSVRSCHRLRLQIAQPNQIVGRRCPLHLPAYLLPAAESHLAQQSDGIHPPEALLHPLALLLTDGVPGMPGGAHVDRARSIRIVLGYMRRDVCSQVADGIRLPTGSEGTAWMASQRRNPQPYGLPHYGADVSVRTEIPPSLAVRNANFRPSGQPVRRAIACNGLRHPWQLWHPEQPQICNLLTSKGGTGFESHPLRQIL